jgi:hypothetical protein
VRRLGIDSEAQRRKQRLTIRGVARDVTAVYRSHWLFLIVAAMIVLLPQALADGFADSLQIEGIHSARDVAVLAAVPLTATVNLFGQAFYAGVAAAAVVEWRAHQPLPRTIALIRSLPLGRLVLLDLVITFGTALGLLLFVIPALLVLAYFSLAPVMVKFEHLGVWDSMRRSAELVRGHFWSVLLIVVGTILATEFAIELVDAPFHGAALVAAVNLAADGLLQPIEGLVIVVVTLQLLEMRGEAPETAALERAVGGGNA